MARPLAAFVFVMTLLTAVPRVQAQFGWVRPFCHSVATDFKRNNCWPEPFVGPDRLAVRSPFNIMVQNGWVLQNTVSDHHFSDATGELTEAGRHRVYWILNHAPKQHRIVYVQKSRKPEVTARRMELVQAAAEEFAPEGTLAQVEPTIHEPPGWTADRVNFVNSAFEASAPAPQLPQATTKSK